MSTENYRQRLSSPFPEPADSGLLQASAHLASNPLADLSDDDTQHFVFSPLPARVAPGTVIDGFKILEEIGSGGMSTVYRALQENRDRVVALKVLSPHLLGVPTAIERFAAEATLASRVAHPGIVPVYSRGEDGGYHYYSMKWIDGPTLEEFIDGAAGTRGEMFFRESALMFAAVARTVAMLHENGVVHRDIKPANLLLEGSGRLLLADFGLAVDFRDPPEEDLTEQRGETVFLGTPAYASPERFVRADTSLSPRSDIYSVGLSLYELVTGILPFPRSGGEEMARLKLTRKPPSPRSIVPKVPLGLEAIIRQAIDIHLELRYAQAEDLARDLERFANTRRTNTRCHPSTGAPLEDELDDDDNTDGEPALIV